MQITELDRKILRAGYMQGIQKGQKAFFQRMNLNRSTVDYVLEKLRKEKYYSRKSYEINLPALGIPRFAWVFVSINWYLFDEEKFLKQTLSFPEIPSVLKITGDYDYALYVIGTSIPSLNEFILDFEKIFQEDIDSVHIIFSNKEYKRHFVKTKIIPPTHELPNKVDCLLLDEKLKNPDMSLIEIAKKHQIHRNTISNRWRKTWKGHLLLKEHLELTEEGYKEIGMGLKLFIIIKPVPGKEENLISQVINMDEVENVFTTLSNEIVINLRVSDSPSLDLFHKKLMGGKERVIKNSRTILIIGGQKKSYLTMNTLQGINNKVCPNCLGTHD